MPLSQADTYMHIATKGFHICPYVLKSGELSARPRLRIKAPNGLQLLLSMNRLQFFKNLFTRARRQRRYGGKETVEKLLNNYIMYHVHHIMVYVKASVGFKQKCPLNHLIASEIPFPNVEQGAWTSV